MSSTNSDRRRRRKPQFNPGRLFANGEQGAWYDPADFATLYKDVNGFEPVTSLGTEVGLMLDKANWDGRGVVNLLKYSSNMIDGATDGFLSVGFANTLTTSSETTPAGDTSAFLVGGLNAGSPQLVLSNVAGSYLNGLAGDGPLCFSYYAKAGTNDFGGITLFAYDGSIPGSTLSKTLRVDLTDGSAVEAGSLGSFLDYGVEDAGNGWYRIWGSVDYSSVTGDIYFRYLLPYSLASSGFPTAADKDGQNISVWHPQVNRGTTPVPYQITTEQMGGPGNHAAQGTPTARPTVQARVNLLERSEAFDQDPPWDLINATIDSNVTTAPNGTLTADKLKEAATTGSHFVEYPENRSGSVTFSVYAKASERTQIRLREHLGFASAYYDLSNGTAVASAGTASIQDVGNGWYRCIISYSYGATLYFSKIQIYTAISGSSSYTGDGTSGVYLWGAQLELGSTATTYQRVTTATDYQDIGLPRYLEFDGVDDAMATQSVDFTGTDEVTVCGGVYKASDAATAALVELSAAIETNNGVFALFAPSGAGSNSYRFFSKGTVSESAGTGGFATAPDLSVVSGLADISADTITLRRNGSIVETDTNDQGTGNYGDHIIYVGNRNGTAFELNGRIHQLIIRGATTAGALLDQTERFVARKTGVTL